ncbi:PREDICTED: mucin-17-like [Branchiostoma belcheri]|uniref:Mucin-17-like n=2 Tax=Branchiostoma belcheri TaxID=7741 RepID=A0A6P4Z5G4_BRABE|nr:PREDICTED: mucin-17-like [Branchiostoma belcheri]
MPGRRRLLQMTGTTPAVATTASATESSFDIQIINVTVKAGGQLEILFVVVNLNSSDPIVDPDQAINTFSQVTSEEFSNITASVASSLNITGMPTVGRLPVTTTPAANVTTSPNVTTETTGFSNDTTAHPTAFVTSITTVLNNTTMPGSNATTTESTTVAATLVGNVTTVTDNVTAITSTPGLLNTTPVANVTGTTSSLDNVTSAETINVTDAATTVLVNVTDVTATATAAVTAPTMLPTTTDAVNVTTTPAAENTTAVNVTDVTMAENATAAVGTTTEVNFTAAVNVTGQTTPVENITSLATTVITALVTENATIGVNVTGVTMPVNATTTSPTTPAGDNVTTNVNVTDITPTADHVTLVATTVITENATMVMNVTVPENATSDAPTATVGVNTTAVTGMTTIADNATSIETTVVTMLVTENATAPVNVTDVTTVVSTVTAAVDNATSAPATVATLPTTDNATSVMNVTGVATVPDNATAAPNVTGSTTEAENVTTASTPLFTMAENTTAITGFNTTMPVNVTVPTGTVAAENITSTTGISATATTENVTAAAEANTTAVMPPATAAENTTATTIAVTDVPPTATSAANVTTANVTAAENTTVTTTAVTGVPPTTAAAENITAAVTVTTTASSNTTVITVPAVTSVVENTTATMVNTTTVTAPGVTAVTNNVTAITGVTPETTVSGNQTAAANTTAAATTPMSPVSSTGASTAATPAGNATTADSTTTMAVTANTTAGTGTASTATAITVVTPAATTGLTHISTTAGATSLAATPVSTAATEAANITAFSTTPAITGATNTPVPSISALTTKPAPSTAAITTKPENTTELATTEEGTTAQPFVTVVNPSTIVPNQVTVIVLSLTNDLQQIMNEIGNIIQVLTNLLQEWYRLALSKQANQPGQRRRLLQSPSIAPGSNFVIQVTNVTVLPGGQVQVQFVVVDSNNNNTAVPPSDVTAAFNQVSQQEVRALSSSVGFPLDINEYTVQPLVTEEAPASSLLWILWVVLGSLLFIIIVLLLVYNFVTTKGDAVQPKKREDLGNKLSERYVQKGGLGSVGLLIPAQLPGVPQTSQGQTSYQLRDETEKDKEWIAESGLKVDRSKGSITLIPPARPPNKDDVREFGTHHKQPGKEAWSDKDAPPAERTLTVEEKPKRSKKEKRKKWRGPAKKHRKEHERPRRTEIPVRPPVRLVGSYESVKSAASMDQIEHEAALFEHVALMNKLEDGEKKRDTPSVRFKATVHPLQPLSSLPPLKDTPLVTKYTTENEVDAVKEAVLEEEDEVLREKKMKAVKEEDWDTLDTIIKLRAEVEHLRNKERQREKQKRQQQAAKTPGKADGPLTPMPPPKPLTQQEKQRIKVKEVWEDAQKQLEGLLEPQYFTQATMTPVARKMQAARRNRWRTQHSRLGSGHPADVLPGEVQFDKKMGRNMRAAQPKVGDYMRTDSNIKLVRVAPISDEANTAGREIPITAQPRSIAEQARREAAILGQGGDPYVQLLRMASIPSPMAPLPQSPSQSPSQQLRDDEEVQRLLEEAFPLEESRVEDSVTSRSVTETERGTVKSGKTGDRKSEGTAKRKLRPKTAAVAPDDSLQSTSTGLSPRPPRQAFSEPRVPQLLTPPTGISLSGDRTPYHDPYYTPAMVDTVYGGHPSVRTSTPRAPRFSTMAQPTPAVDPYGHGMHHPAMGRAYRRVSPGTELPQIQPGRASSHLVWQPETPAMMSRYGDLGPGVMMQNPIYDYPRPSVGGLNGSLYEPERTNLSFLDQLRSTPVRAYTQPSPHGGVQQPMAQPSQQPTTGQQPSQEPITEHSLPGVMSSLTNDQRDTLLQLIREEYGKLEEERATKK